MQQDISIKDKKAFRPNVCAVPTDGERTKVLVFRRVDRALGLHCWQFPQGGLMAGEAPEAGMLRELEEEIGTADAEVLATLAQPIRYQYPPEVLARLAARDPAKAGFLGQEQSWFLVHLRRGTDAIHFRHQPAEFDAFRWVDPGEAVELVVPFKKSAYRMGLAGLGLLPPCGDH